MTDHTRIVTSAPGKNQRLWSAEPSVTDWDSFTDWITTGWTDGGKYGRPYCPVTLAKTPGRRLNINLVERHVLTLDADSPGEDYLDRLSAALPFTALSHTTASHTPEAPRWRTLVPVSRALSPAEAKTLAYHFIDQIGRERFDEQASTSPIAVVYAPAWDGVEYHKQDGPVLDADDWLLVAEPKEWSANDAAGAPTLGEFLAEQDGKDIAECDYGRAALDGAVAELDATVEGSGVHPAIFAAACRFVEMVQAGCWSVADLPRLRETALRLRREQRPSEFDEALVNALKKGCEAETGCGVHESPEQVFVPEDGPQAQQAAPAGQQPAAAPPLAVRLRERVTRDHNVFPGDDDGRIFVQPKKGGRAELLTGGFVIRAGRGAGMQMSTLSAAATEASKVLAALAEVEPPRSIHTRVCHSPGRIVLDLAQPGNSRCVVITSDGWSVEAVPPADVVFRAAGKALPDPERGGDVEDLRALLRWEADDPRWPLIKGWLPASMLALLPRPLLAFFGPQGSAKSTTGRFVTGVLDPKPKGVLGSGFGKKQSDDETKALGSFYAAWDNVSRMSEDGADFLSRLVTGDSIERRKLYSDTDLVQIVYRRTGVITGVNMPRGIKPDTLDRLVVVPLGLLTERLGEAEMEAAWEAAHPRILAGVLDLAVRMLAGEKRNPDRLRMADYAAHLWAIDPALYAAYAENVHDARGDMASNDPFIATLLAWLKVQKGRTWKGTATEARAAADHHRAPELAWWPSNAKTFMDTVTAQMELLREVGVTVTETKVKGVRYKQFTLRDDAGLQ